MARKSNVVEFHDDERKQAEKVISLRSWQRLLREQPSVATVQIGHVLQKLAETRLYHRFELAKNKAQMLNGVCCPSDFAFNSGGSHKIL